MQKVAIIGLGYVGLPLARQAVKAGLSVIGVDASKHVVDLLNEGRSHVDDITDDDVAMMVKAGFGATHDAAAIGDADICVICVPTPLTADGLPELAAVTSACHDIARHLRPGMVVVLESTTYPGTTDEVVKPILEESGLRAGKDFHLAFSPERVDPGNLIFRIDNTPKVVGGLTQRCAERASWFYSKITSEVVLAKGTREAEMTKLLENTYRHINIALVNELARVCHELDIDVWDVVRCASTKPFGFESFSPGPGVGGHCIPIDPNYLSYAVKAKLGYPLRFVELAQEINGGMPRYVFSRVQELLNLDALSLRGSRVLLVGVTYKPNISDQRESPAVPLAQQLMAAGVSLAYHDPHVGTWVDGVDRVELHQKGSWDAAVVLQHHKNVDLRDLGSVARRVLDCRGILTGANVEAL